MEREDRYVFQAIWKGALDIIDPGSIDMLCPDVNMQIDAYIVSQKSVLHFWKVFDHRNGAEWCNQKLFQESL